MLLHMLLNFSNFFQIKKLKMFCLVDLGILEGFRREIEMRKLLVAGENGLCDGFC